ncbi:TEF transcription factor, PAR bZIP family member b isoform X2 [Chanos chanos]|uniref:TEF transcription factor, PAR bZIP family member b isoform X2 n=1 Tax=Chanos chanos TaxID=29144 RepID=A0A6J2X021_CHACN|nr:thyrotroph embryonic factor-like isoform X2 [Chanos chanos]
MAVVNGIHGGEMHQAFKSFLEYPVSFANLTDNEIEKEKLCSSEDGESGGGGGGSGAAGGGGGATGGGVSASLTPTIWDKTIPYDGETFHLEYMDLDEFLLENGIPASLEEELQKSHSPLEPQSTHAPPPGPRAPTEKEKEKEKEREKESEEVDEEEDGVSVSDVSELEVTDSTGTETKATPTRVTPTPINPDEIEVDVKFEPDPTDLVLSSVPGGELFNPRKHRFSDEELKPQPMIKKAKKVFVPEEAKDDKYWSRRKKNNMAAKRSRDARRLKENQITVRAAFLERENEALRQEVAELRKDCGRCKNVISLYEAKYGLL